MDLGRSTRTLALLGALGACSAGGGGPETTSGSAPPPATEGDAAAAAAPSDFPADPYVTGTSDGGALRIEVRTAPTQPPPRGTFTVELTVTGASGPVDGLTVGVVPWMPAMGHGSSITPTVTPKGNGKYVITNVSLFMPGTWSLRLSFSGAVAEKATLAVDVP